MCECVCKKEGEKKRETELFSSADSEQCSRLAGSPVLVVVVVVSEAESDIDPDLRDHCMSDTPFHSSLTIQSFDISLSSLCANLFFYFASSLSLSLLLFFLLC